MSATEAPRVELHTTDAQLWREARITIRVGSEIATLTASEWSKLLAHPQRGSLLHSVPCTIPSTNKN